MTDTFQAYTGRPAAVGGRALDPVNAPMIRHWCEAMGDANTAYTGPDAVAPPAMLQSWTMAGLGNMASGRSEAYDELLGTLDAAGFTSVVATDCEQEYLRSLRPGQRVLYDSEIESVSAEKTTALGVGRFVTTRTDVRAYDEAAGEKPEEAAPVATHRFRILKFRPAAVAATATEATGATAAAGDRALRPRPVVNRDNAGFWAGVAEGELRFQRCTDCATPRFPWLPGCNACGSDAWAAEAASGAGTVYSYVVVHHPIPAAFRGRSPYNVALVELEEGVRMVSNVQGLSAAEVRIGLPVRLDFERCDEELTLPVFRPAGADDLPPLRVPVTRTLIVAGAIASRDYQDVHHDVELAHAKGAPDIFMNILTSNGLVGRYVTDWAGPRARLTGISVRLGVPAYPGDELTFTGRVTERDGPRLTVAVTGRHRRGAHATATVRLTMEARPTEEQP